MIISEPLIQADLEEARKRTASAISLDFPIRPSGYQVFKFSNTSGLSSLRACQVAESIVPGTTVLQRIPSGPYLTATVRVKACMPAFATL